ncbi:MAG: hypothetical protein WC552_05315 [Candidatus Omnitrophota bacterium]
MKKLVLVLFVALAVFCACGISRAQDMEEENYSYGLAVSVSGEEIILLEHDYETEADLQVSYTVTPDTELTNINSLGDIAQDDAIEIYYKEADGKKTATAVIKELNSEEGAEDWQQFDETIQPIDMSNQQEAK